MRRKTIPGLLAVIIAGGLLLGLGGSRTDAQTSTTAVSYPAGWNLVAFPPGTDLSSVPGPRYTLQPGDSNYETVNPSQGSVSGFGYWAYFTNPTTVRLATSNTSTYQVSVPAGQWVMVGDPSDTASVLVSRPSSVYVYLYNADGGAYVEDAMLEPGEGAWVYSTAGDTLQLTSAPAPHACGTVSVFSLSLSPSPTAATGISSAEQADNCFNFNQCCGLAVITPLPVCISASLTAEAEWVEQSAHEDHGIKTTISIRVAGLLHGLVDSVVDLLLAITLASASRRTGAKRS